MRVRKAVITAAGKNQRALPMQTLFDQEGTERSVLSLIVREAIRAGIGDVGIVISPGDEDAYAKLLANDPVRVTFISQQEPRGYAHAVFCAREFVHGEPFLHCVGDHIYAGSEASASARQLLQLAEAIARELRLSEHTVKNYLFKAFEKLGVSSRIELLFYLTMRGQAVGASSGASAEID